MKNTVLMYSLQPILLRDSADYW